VSDELLLAMNGVLAGRIARRGDALALHYDDDYRRAPGATPLSLTLPLGRTRHPTALVSQWLSALLPDDLDVRRRWAREFETKPDAFSLLATPVGEDCAGAVQLATPERAEEMLRRAGRVRWLDDAAIATRLRDLTRDQTSWLGGDLTGQFSLAGMQAKTALHRRGGRWGDPSGRTPTTHIVKPAIAGYQDHDLNEHLCMDAARRLGLTVARTEVVRFGRERALVVERYDRVRAGRSLVRVHQEDLCQATGRDPGAKYQWEGGPAPEEIVALFRRVMPRAAAEDACVRFVDALAWSWIVAATDAHSRNYSLLLAAGDVRLAPLYDIASVLPYDGVDPMKARLAMKLGGRYRLKEHTHTTWPKTAVELGLDAGLVIDRVRHLVDGAVDAIADAASALRRTGIRSPMGARLTAAVAARVDACRRQLP